MIDNDAFALDRAQLRAAFERAAPTYDAAADLQRDVAQQLLARLDDVRLAPARVLDVGCGTGFCTYALARRYRRAQVVGVDLATAMARQARRRGRWRLSFNRPCFSVGDAERLPIASASVDLLVSNLALQWCQPQRALAEFRRVLRPGGLLMFATFGPDTLREVRGAWSIVDQRPHVHGFLDMRDLGDIMLHGGFSDPVVDVERVVRHYDDVRKVLHELKQIGAHNVAAGRSRGLTGKGRFAHFREVYESMAGERGIPATYEIVFGSAWITEAGKIRREHGDAIVPLSAIRRHRE
jgi:malonyl-CoA O-methyltransferase